MATVAIKIKTSCVRPTPLGARIPFEPPGISYILNIQTYNAQGPGKSGFFHITHPWYIAKFQKSANKKHFLYNGLFRPGSGFGLYLMFRGHGKDFRHATWLFTG